jgi:hypothetical protein
LLAAAALIATFAGEMRRRPQSRVAQHAVIAYLWCRATARYLLESAAARAEVRWQSLRLTRWMGKLQAARRAQLLRLGEAVYAEDAAIADAARTAVSAIDDRLAACGNELDTVFDRARRRIVVANRRRGRLVGAGVRDRMRGPVRAG